MWGVKKIIPKKNQHGLNKRKKKGQLEFAALVSPRIRSDEKGALMNAPSIHVDALVSVG